MDTWTLCSELINGKLCPSQEGPSGNVLKECVASQKEKKTNTVIVVVAVELRLRFLTDFTTL